MNILISFLLGAAVFVLQAATSEETLKVSVSVWPPGSNVYIGEYVLLQCTVESNSSFVGSYQWFRSKPTPNPRHLASGDSYSIAAVKREDADSYWCQAKRWESSTRSVLVSQQTTLSVSELPLHSLTLTPSTRQVFRGERFTVRCPVSQTNSSGWMLRQFSPGRRVRKRVLHTDRCSPLGGAASTNKSDTCTFAAGSENSGLYWCEGAEGRSNAVNITVSYGGIIMRTPAFPVFEGDTVVLHCLYWKGILRNSTLFFKNGSEIFAHNSSSSDRLIKMTIENVTQEDEGFYKCTSEDRRMESPESWLSVRPGPGQGNFTSVDDAAALASGTWTWIGIVCGLVLFLLLIPLSVWLVCHHRYSTFCSRSCWPLCKSDIPAVELPATKHDATEVQWDLSWMEMSNLLDKHLYPGTSLPPEV